MEVYFADGGEIYEVYLSTNKGDWDRLSRGEVLDCDLWERDFWDSGVKARFSLQASDRSTDDLAISVDSENWRKMTRVDAVVDRNQIDRSKTRLAGSLSFKSRGYCLIIREDDREDDNI